MNPEEQAARERDMEAVRREMYRKSRDILRIYNPLDFDFKFYYDGYPQIIKAKQTKDVERYLASLYFKKVSEYLISQMVEIKGNGMLADREKRGLPGYLDKYAENKEIWDKMPSLGDRTLLEQIADQVILGLVEEYGLEAPDEQKAAEFKAPDSRSLHDQIMDVFNHKLVEDEPETAPEAKPVKEKLAMEVTAE